MIAYSIRRLLQGIPTVLGVLFVFFFIFFMVNDPDKMARGANGGDKASAQAIEEWKAEKGYNLPLFFNWKAPGFKAKCTETRFYSFYSKMLTFQFGKADTDDELIIDKIKKGAGPSLALTVPIFLIGLFISISISLVVALFMNTYVDRFALVLCVLGMSVVVFLYIIGGQYIMGKMLRWFAISGWSEDHKFHFLFLPVLVGVIDSLSRRIRLYRTIMVNEVNSDYMRTARAKGVGDSSLLFKHLLKNSMIPILTGVVMSIPYLFTGALLLEAFFGIPGLGKLTINAIINSDFATLSAMVFIGSLLYVVFNLITDLSYTLVDPRVKLQ